MKTGIYWQDPKCALKPGQDFILDPSLVLYLPLHQLDGACFMSKDAYGHLCTVTGALWNSRGRSFDGDDYVDCGGDANICSITGDLTLEAWAKKTVSSGDTTVLGTKQGRNDYTTPYNLYIMGPDNTPRFRLGEGDDQCLADSTVGVTIDEWAHLVATIEGNNAKIWVNAVETGSDTFAGTRQTGLKLTLGAANATGDRPFTGVIDLVRIYNRALTPMEIQRNYLATKRRYQ